MIILLLIIAALSLFARTPQPQPASFDLNDPQAARAKYAQLAAIDGWTAQGQAWCNLTPAEIRAIAQHTRMSNTITTTIRTNSNGETTTKVTIQPAPNQTQLVEHWANRIADECRYNTWANLEKLSAAANDAERVEVMCSLGSAPAAMLLRFLMSSFTSESSKSSTHTGESTEIIIERPPEPADETAITNAIKSLSTQCNWKTN